VCKEELPPTWKLESGSSGVVLLSFCKNSETASVSAQIAELLACFASSASKVPPRKASMISRSACPECLIPASKDAAQQ
jgi:hypothetical protein